MNMKLTAHSSQQICCLLSAAIYHQEATLSCCLMRCHVCLDTRTAAIRRSNFYSEKD